jgi:CheY-like chemotaxis protein
MRILIRKRLISGDNLAATEQTQAGLYGKGSAGMSSSGTSTAGTGVAMGRVLLVCEDAAAVQQLAEGMQQFAIATEVCADASVALGLLNRKKFEAVIVDFGLAQADELLEQIRLSPSNRTAVTFAITAAGKTSRSELQPNFLMEKPLSAASVARTFKAAFALIVRERRRSFRCPIDIPAAIQANGEEVNCHLVNISEGGLAITGSPALKPGSQVRVRFILPGQVLRFKVEAEVCWYDERRRAGLRSLMIPSEQKSILQQWLAVKLEQDLPESVARQFRRE